MRTYKKEIEGFKMSAFNDSNVDWCVRSIDADGTPRTVNYPIKSFTMREAFELHYELHSRI